MGLVSRSSSRNHGADPGIGSSPSLGNNSQGGNGLFTNVNTSTSRLIGAVCAGNVLSSLILFSLLRAEQGQNSDNRVLVDYDNPASLALSAATSQQLRGSNIKNSNAESTTAKKIWSDFTVSEMRKHLQCSKYYQRAEQTIHDQDAWRKDAVVRVPPGTVVQEEIDIIDEMKLDKTGKRVVLRTEKRDLGTVTVDEPDLLVAEGGEGGEGSATTGKKAGRGVRRPRSSPVGGERRRLKLTLKIVADVALVGVPNAGKSTFLASVTRAKPKIANYPFTTVVPNLGVWVPPNSDGYISDASEGGSGSAGLVLCDVPGLIAGAAEGVGLGHAFLRHVERCHVILHLVDATSADPIGDFDMLNREILRYGNGKLARMPQIVVVNKVDAWEEGRREEWEQGLRVRMSKEELEEKLRAAMTHSRLMWMSAKEGEGVDDLMGRMAMFVRKVKEAGEEN